MRSSLLIAYFIKMDDALDAYRKVRHQGFLRLAWASRNADGEIRIHNPFPGRCVIGVLSFSLFFALLTTWIVSYVMPESETLGSYPLGWVFILTGGLVGGLLAATLLYKSKLGVDRHILAKQVRWLIAGETVLILQVPTSKLMASVSLLRDTGENPPSIYIMNPLHIGPDGDEWCHETALNPIQLQEHAHLLAMEHHLSDKPLRDAGLLHRLDRGRRWVQEICLDLTSLSRLQQNTPPSAEWLLDNEYIFESNAREAKRNLPWRYYRQLSALSNEPYQGLPRIYALAREYVAYTDLSIDQHNLLAFIESYQSAVPLSIGELWAVPQMLRIALLEGIQQIAGRVLHELHEREIADFWANRLIAANRRDPNQLFSLMAELTGSQPNPTPYLATQLIDHLYDEGAALAPVQSWLERTFDRSMNTLIMREKIRQPKDQISISNAFTSLRQLSLFDWKECFEQLSHVDRILNQDPAGIYAQMDFVTRDQYRKAIEDLRRGSRLPEAEIARRIVSIASQASLSDEQDALSFHVGTYLIGEKRNELAQSIHCHETYRFRALHWAYRHPTLVYFSGLAVFITACISVAIMLGLHDESPGIYLLAILLLLIPVSQLSVNCINYLVMRLFPPRPLPKMDYSLTGIPDACRTLVVVPMLLVDDATIHAETEKLEIRYLANKEDNLLFALASDYSDALTPTCEEDAALLETAKESIRNLNQRHGSDRFFLIHRERQWSESEQKYIGWERKRGKLEELNDLIVGERSRDAANMVLVGDADQLTDIRYVITLDSDTQLPHDTARRMIETLSHPLIQPRYDESGRIRTGSYTIIQPRVSSSLPSTTGSLFSRLFSDPVGIDPYTNTVSDAYQDLTSEGSYHGKGIYDVRAFSHILSKRFPEAWLLSHDLLEGTHVRVGLASDIELFDEFPQDYHSYAKRLHRWIRGDWQIAAWIMPSVPCASGVYDTNPLSMFNRWKVLDNLRRSLLPAASLLLLYISWLTSSQAGWVATALVTVQLFFHSLAQPLTWATTGLGFRGISLGKIGHDVLRVLVEAALLPHQAYISLDAILRVLYRRNISHRRLLEWTTAQAMNKNVVTHTAFMFIMASTSFLSILIAGVVLYFNPTNIWVTIPWLTLWLLSIPIGWLLNHRSEKIKPQYLLEETDRILLGQIACRTWRFFADFVNESTSWLPPDNYQVSHQNSLAMRTSPTNIGLYMTSVLSAYDFGYITLDAVSEKLAHTMDTINRLEHYEGHLLNWYDIQTLEPLKPLYVSTVDSGNFLGALITTTQGLDTIVHTPLVDTRVFAGLRDTGHVLHHYILGAKVPTIDVTLLEELMSTWSSPPESLLGQAVLLRQTELQFREWSIRFAVSDSDQASVVYWSRQLQDLLTAWLELVDRYLPWIVILAERNLEEINELVPDDGEAFHHVLSCAPSLHELAESDNPCITTLQTLRDQNQIDADDTVSWIDRILSAYSRSKWVAGEVLAQINQLSSATRNLSESINMRFLYNTDRHLFSIGYFMSEGRLDHSFYDLLASEARLGSYIAIARGDIPAHHWFALSRPYGAIGRRRALLSWAGTMFEYLMPQLFQHSYANTLLDKATREAVMIQIAYGRKRKIPWGISECAFGDLDHNKTYQYYAFGVPELALRRETPRKIVVSPYATMLAIAIVPRYAMQNLKRLDTLGLLSDYGYYESLDYSRKPSREGDRGVIVQAYMAHHQGMSFLALGNFLHNDNLKNYFHSDTCVRTFEPLLHERIPNLPPLHHIPARERVLSPEIVGEVAPSVTQFDSPHTALPRTQLLSNGRYGLMVTGAGGGYSRWEDFDISRWRSDTTRDSWGSFCYIYEAYGNRLWCNSYHPVDERPDQYSVSFSLDRADFQRVDYEIETRTEIVVAPEDDVEIRRITLVNRSGVTRSLMLTSYIELSLAPHNADRQHPAFNKLFIQTESLPEQQALIAWRRPRSANETPIYVVLPGFVWDNSLRESRV